MKGPSDLRVHPVRETTPATGSGDAMGNPWGNGSGGRLKALKGTYPGTAHKTKKETPWKRAW